MSKKSTDPVKIWSSFQLWHFFKVAQSYPHGPKLAQLTVLCRASVSSGVFPRRWKSANIVPIFKKGEKKIPSNYRSVSLLPLFGKVLERVVYDQLFRYASAVIGAEQHGFMPQRSCATNLDVYLRSAWEVISDGYQTDAIYTDYPASFQSHYSQAKRIVSCAWFCTKMVCLVSFQ